MPDISAARSQMGISLLFHIVFAAWASPATVVGHGRVAPSQKPEDYVYDRSARRWNVGTAIMFAVGAVSGTRTFFRAWAFVATPR
jgi:cytochrome d ubiquinol oxidase subunit I